MLLSVGMIFTVLDWGGGGGGVLHIFSSPPLNVSLLVCFIDFHSYVCMCALLDFLVLLLCLDLLLQRERQRNTQTICNVSIS